MQLGCRLNERNSTKMDSDQVNIFTLPLCPTGNPNLYLIFNCLQRSAANQNRTKKKKKRNLACKFNSITKWHRSEMLHPVLFPQRHEGANGNIKISDNPLDVAELYAWLIKMFPIPSNHLIFHGNGQRVGSQYSTFTIFRMAMAVKKWQKTKDEMRAKPICAHWGAKFMALSI